MAKKKLPRDLYVRFVEPANDEPYLIAARVMTELDIEIGDKVTVGRYRLAGFYEAEGLIETSTVKKV